MDCANSNRRKQGTMQFSLLHLDTSQNGKIMTNAVCFFHVSSSLEETEKSYLKL